MHRLLRAALNTWNGLVAAARSEASFREELVTLAVAIPAAFFLAPDYWKFFILIAAVVFVMVVELINTAVEKLSDVVMPAQDPRIARIKDMTSAAVGLSIAIAGTVWLLVLLEKFALL